MADMSPKQKAKFKKVMKEFSERRLKDPRGDTVTTIAQAMAIAAEESKQLEAKPVKGEIDRIDNRGVPAKKDREVKQSGN